MLDCSTSLTGQQSHLPERLEETKDIRERFIDWSKDVAKATADFFIGIGQRIHDFATRYKPPDPETTLEEAGKDGLWFSEDGPSS